jgi:hypothetical protein
VLILLIKVKLKKKQELFPHDNKIWRPAPNQNSNMAKYTKQFIIKQENSTSHSNQSKSEKLFCEIIL